MFKLKIFLLFIAVNLIVISLVSAVGISKYYYEGEPAKLSPGESKIIPVALLMASEEKEDRIMKLEIVNDAGIANLIDNEIKVPAGSIDKEIKMQVNIPPEASEGMKYIVDFKVSDITSSKEKGMVGFNTGQAVSIPVIVEKSTAEPTFEKPIINYSLYIIILVIIIAIAIAAYFLLRKKGNIKSK